MSISVQGRGDDAAPAFAAVAARPTQGTLCCALRAQRLAGTGTDPTLRLAGEAAGGAAGGAAAAGSEAGGGGGLHTLFTMVLGGLVGASPHMVSASVMALARLLHEFAAQLGGAAPALLPAVLMLLRSRAREVVKAVLGFVKARARPPRPPRRLTFPPVMGGSGAVRKAMKVVCQACSWRQEVGFSKDV